jgi:hypothetical protein
MNIKFPAFLGRWHMPRKDDVFSRPCLKVVGKLGD